LKDEDKIYEKIKNKMKEINTVNEYNQKNTSNCENNYDCSVNKIYEKILTILDDRNTILRVKAKNIINLLKNDIKPDGIIYNTIANDIPNNNNNNNNNKLIKVLIVFLEKEIIKKIKEEPEKRFKDGNRFYPDEGPKVQFIEKLIKELKYYLASRRKATKNL